MNFKLTKLEKYWILYDVGNSAFILLVTTIVPIYFNSLAGSAGLSDVQYLAYWGYAASVATLLVAVSGPIFGTIADNKGYKKMLFLASILIGVIGCMVLGFLPDWFIFIIVFVIAKYGFSLSLVFYDAMLIDVTTEERMDNVSSQGYAWGYIGSCIPFVGCLVLVLAGEKIGISTGLGMILSFILVGLWWIGASLPLLKNYEQKYYVEKKKGAVAESFVRLGQLFGEIKGDKKVFLFLLAYFFYIDGVQTIIDMATAFGTAVGLDTTGLLLALLVTQIVAFPCSIIFGRLSQKYDTAKLITIAIIGYTIIAIYALTLHQQFQFWILAVAVGMFQGGIQALSRSYYARIIPGERSGEYFGLLDICGKGAAFLGTTLVSLGTQLTGDVNKGISMIAIMFVIGLVLFRKAAGLNRAQSM